MVSSRSHSIWMMSRLHRNALSFFSTFLFLFAFCARSTVASAQPNYVQQCNQYTAGGGSGATASCTLSGVGAGHALLIGIWSSDSALSSVTASSGTPTSVIPAFNDNGYGYTYAYLLANTASGNITVTASETGYYAAIYISVSEFSNVATSPLDVTGTGQQNIWGASAITTGNFTTTTASDMLWSFCAGLSGETFSVGTAPITWTQISNTAPSRVLFVEYGAAGSAGSYNGQCYKSSTGYDTSIITVAFKPSTVAATPTFSPGAGTYTSVQTVTISDLTTGATIYYTTNGTTPTTSSAVYSSAIAVSTSETLEAIATATGYTQSATGSAAYVINLPVTATPIFNPGAGTYTSVQTVTISDATSGATIYYTTNGTTPTTNSAVYSGAITVSATETLEAIATATGYTQSATGSAAYAINLPLGPSYVQQCSQYKAGGGSGASASCTLTGVGAGHALMIGVWTPAATLSSVTSSAGTPVSVISNYNASGTYGYLSAYILPNAAAGSITITATETGYYDADWLTVAEYSNVPASPLDGSGTGSTGSSSYGPANVNSSNFTTTSSSDML